MIKIFICWILLAIPRVTLLGQTDKPSLIHDLTFERTVMKYFRFPGSAQLLGESVRVYVGFTLTKQGEYQDVAVVNRGTVDELLKQEVYRVWSRLPKQDPRYAGKYVIPVAFLLGEGSPKRLKPLSNETDTISRGEDYTLLGEVSLIGYLVCERKAMTN